MEVRLAEINTEERERGRGFMMTVKERWDEEFPEYSRINSQTLRANAARFKMEPEIKELTMVEEPRDQVVNVQEESRVTGGLRLNEECREGDAGVGDDGTCRDNVTDLEEGDAELENEFLKQLKEIGQTSICKIEPRERLKLKMTTPVERSSNRTLEKYLEMLMK